MHYPVHVALLPSLIPPELLPEIDVAIVIDALRFTTTACQALEQGAAEVVAVAEISSALELAERESLPPLLCGERHCRPIPGFDLGNSPLEYTPDRVGGKRLLFSTTNGTRAVEAVRDVGLILLAGFVNREAIVERVQQLPSGHKLCIVCAGTDGQIALEDVLVAGAILAARDVFEPKDDAAQLALTAWQTVNSASGRDATSERLHAVFRQCAGGANLVLSGYASDLPFCAQLDTHHVVPIASSPFNLFRRAASAAV